MERKIREEWIKEALNQPASVVAGNDGRKHYLKEIPERGGKVLRVIVNINASPPTVVTVFFDRRVRGQI